MASNTQHRPMLHVVHTIVTASTLTLGIMAGESVSNTHRHPKGATPSMQ
jgi:hypothetical protein